MIPLEPLAEELGRRLRARGWRLATAESCTGGWIAKVATDIPGSSAWFECGFVVYSNAAKQELLGVDAALLRTHGAVSAETVAAMAEGAVARSRAQVAVAVSGIAGPGGGSDQKPVGTVFLAWSLPGREGQVEHRRFAGDRAAIRRQTVQLALEQLIVRLSPDG